MRIQHNIPAMSAYRNYTTNVSALSKNLEKLSSGYKINRAGDDAAGLAISEKMRAQISGLEQAQTNAKSGINLVQTAEGALTEVHDMLNRMYTLAEQSANGTYDDSVDRVQLQKEVDQLRAEIDRIADSSNFNGIKLLDGSMSSEATGAISNITSTKFEKASSTPEAFTTSFIRERPATAAAGDKATFVVNLDDIKFSGTGTGAKLSLKVGGTEIKATATGAANAFNTAKIIAGLLKGGSGKWSKGAFVAATGSGANCIQINGHTFQMASNSGTGIKFTQMDSIPVGAEGIYPDFKVESTLTAGKAGNKASGDINWQVQLPTVGEADKVTHQARADLTIDFTKLKDGDQFIVGEGADAITFSFKTKTNTVAAADASKIKQIDLSGYDLTDATDQKQAMLDIVNAMGTKLTTTATKVAWTVGNEGVSKNVGTVSFQSLSNTTEDLTTEEKVMKQFSGLSPMQDASTSFDIDVSKLKVGDTLTVGGTTYEFLDTGNTVSNGDYKAITITGLKDGLLAKDTATVTSAIKTEIEKDKFGDGSTAKYAVTVDGNKVTISSKDLGATTEAENQKAVKVSATGAGNGGLVLQIGDTAESFNQLRVSIKDMHVSSMGDGQTSIADISIADQESAQAAVDVIKSAINYVSDVRGTLGATQNRLDHTINNLSVMQENIQDAESTIRDVDVAKEMMEYTKNNILVQSAQAMLAQANQLPQGVLQLLG